MDGDSQYFHSNENHEMKSRCNSSQKIPGGNEYVVAYVLVHSMLVYYTNALIIDISSTGTLYVACLFFL